MTENERAAIDRDMEREFRQIMQDIEELEAAIVAQGEELALLRAEREADEAIIRLLETMLQAALPSAPRPNPRPDLPPIPPPPAAPPSAPADDR